MPIPFSSKCHYLHTPLIRRNQSDHVTFECYQFVHTVFMMFNVLLCMFTYFIWPSCRYIAWALLLISRRIEVMAKWENIVVICFWMEDFKDRAEGIGSCDGATHKSCGMFLSPPAFKEAPFSSSEKAAWASYQAAVSPCCSMWLNQIKRRSSSICSWFKKPPRQSFVIFPVTSIIILLLFPMSCSKTWSFLQKNFKKIHTTHTHNCLTDVVLWTATFSAINVVYHIDTPH